MAVLPVTLIYGQVAVYGDGWSVFGIDNATNPSTNVWGVIAQIDSAPAQLAIGANVLYNSNDINSQVQYVYNKFNILAWNKILAIEDPYIPPP